MTTLKPSTVDYSFPGGVSGKKKTKQKNPPANAGDITDLGLIPGLERSPGEGNDYPQQYSGLENSMDTTEPLLLFFTI